MVIGTADATPLEEAGRYAEQCVRAILQAQPPPEAPFSRSSQGVFVTLESKGKVIACRGSLRPTQPTLAAEIRHIARHACRHDPRYGPVTRTPDAVTLTLVDRLIPCPEPLRLTQEDGLVLTWGSQKGIVLPWEGKDPRLRLEWAYQKAKAPRGASVQLEILKARRIKLP
jgi:AMMECR1 domain-containing protein